MEERLDDAINVLRNHAESQLGLVGQLPNNLTPHQITQLNYTAPPQTDSHLPDAIKVERPTYNSSMYSTIRKYILVNFNYHLTPITNLWAVIIM